MRLILTAGLLVLPLLLAAPAAAEFSASRIDAPADGLRVTSTDNATTAPFSGTTTGGVPDEAVSVYCFTRPGAATFVGSATITGPGGAFTGDLSLGAVAGPCVLRAVPGDFAVATGDPTPFAGPLVTVEAQRLEAVGDGPNQGRTTGFDDWLQQTAAGAGLCSLGDAGFCGATLFDAAARRSTEPVFNAGGWIGSSTGTRSYLQVDGANAYPPHRARQLAPDAPGLLGLTRTTTRTTPDGSAVAVESAPIVRCNTPAFPPGEACTAFADTGVRYERTSTVSPDGTTVEQADAVVAVDGAAHTVSTYLGQNFLLSPMIAPALRFGWLPGDSAAVRTAGTELGGPSRGPATIYVGANAAAPDGDPVYAQGAVTFDRPPASVRVNVPTDLLVRFPDVRVPAGGRADVVRATYVLTRTAGEAAARGRALEDRLVGPTVAFTSPRAGATVLTPTVTVTGTVADNVGVASVTMGGVPATVSPSGRFSAAVPMQKGANTVTAVAADGAGNRSEATLKLTYQDRLAPTVSTLYLEPRVWRVGRAARVRFNIGEAGTMRLTASRVTGGRSRKGVCVASTPALRRARAKVCVRYVKLATIVEPRRVGAVSAVIGPKTGGRTLKPGRVQLRVTVTDYANNVSKARTYDTTLRAPLKPARPRT